MPCVTSLSQGYLLGLPASLLLCCGVLADPLLDSLPHERPHSADSPQAYDEVIAQLPRDQAPIAAVVLAKVNIALHRAKERAEKDLCAGQWAPSGALSHQYGPAITSRTLGGEDSEYWFFRSLRLPEEISCEQISRSRFFLEMSRHLPGWITVRPAGQLTAYQEGDALPAARQEFIAVR